MLTITVQKIIQLANHSDFPLSDFDYISKIEIDHQNKMFHFHLNNQYHEHLFSFKIPFSKII